MGGSGKLADKGISLSAYVRGQLKPTIREVTVGEFDLLVAELAGEDVPLRMEDLKRVLESFLIGSITSRELLDWGVLVSWGVHPAMLERKTWRQEDDVRLVRKGISDSRGIRKVHVVFDERCNDTMIEVFDALDDLADSPDELRPDIVVGLLARLRECV